MIAVSSLQIDPVMGANSIQQPIHNCHLHTHNTLLITVMSKCMENTIVVAVRVSTSLYGQTESNHSVMHWGTLPELSHCKGNSDSNLLKVQYITSHI